MLSPVFVASGQNNAYSQSVSAICSFANWIASQTLPPDPGLPSYATITAPFNKAKADALQWFNQVYPACIQIAQQIEDNGTTVSPQVSLLITLAGQLQSQPSNQQLLSQIVQGAGALNASVTQLGTAITKIVSPLQASAGTVNNDGNGMAGQLNVLVQLATQLNQDLGQLYGQLHSLQSATCPSQGDINACNAQIQQTNAQYSTANALEAVLGQAVQSAQGAVQGLSYLAQYWATVAQSAAAVTSALTAVTSAPAALLKIDLTTAQQGWNQLLASAQAATSQTAAMNLAGPATARVMRGAAY